MIKRASLLRGEPELGVGLITRVNDQGASATTHLHEGPLELQINDTTDIKGIKLRLAASVGLVDSAVADIPVVFTKIIKKEG